MGIMNVHRVSRERNVSQKNVKIFVRISQSFSRNLSFWIFEVLLCHINNFSSFTLINVWWREFDFSSYLLKFLSVRQQYILQPWLWSYVFFANFFAQFPFFSQNFRFIFLQKFSLYFRIIFFAFVREIFAFSFSRNRLKWNCRKKNFAKFSRNDFSFSLETLIKTN